MQDGANLLIPADVDQPTLKQLKQTGKLDVIGEHNVPPRNPALLAPSEAGWEAGQKALETQTGNQI